MKKWLVWLLAALLALTAIACGAKTANTDGEQEQEAITDDPNVVADNEYVRIRIEGFEYNQYFGNTVKVRLENKSDKDAVVFTVMDASVNGVEWIPFFAKEVGPSKNVTGEIQFTNPDMETLIGEFTDIVLHFRAENRKTSKDVLNVTYHYYPQGQEKATVYTREKGENDVLIADNGRVAATVIGYECEDVWGGAVNLYLENKSGVPMMFSVKDVSVNGQPCDPFWAHSMEPYTAAYETFYFLKSDFETLNIQKIDTIELTLIAYEIDAENTEWFMHTITLHP